MDVLTDSSLTLIVKTSEPENANVEESTGESPSLLPQFCLCVTFEIHKLFVSVRKLRKNVCST